MNTTGQLEEEITRKFGKNTFKAYQVKEVKRAFDELLNELLSINPKYVDIIDLSNILNARHNTLEKIDEYYKFRKMDT